MSEVRGKGMDMRLVGWRGKTRTRGFTLGRTIDPVIERSPCDVVVMKNCGNLKCKRALVPLSGGPNGALALEVASILAEKDGGEVVVFTVDSGRFFDIEGFVEENLERLALPGNRIKTKVVKARSVARAILKEAADYDLVVTGCTHEPLLYRL